MKAFVEGAARTAFENGIPAAIVARDLDVSASTVKRAIRKLFGGQQITRNNFAVIRHEVEAMPLREAVELLLAALEEVTTGTDNSCIWDWVSLSPSELDLCRVLYKREGRVVSIEEIMACLFATSDDPPEDPIIKVFVHKARRKLAGTGFQIETAWGVGYRMTRAPDVVFPWEPQA